MSVSVSVFWSIIQNFILMLVGMLAMRTGMFSKKALPGLSRFCLDVLMPCLTFHSVTRNFSADQPHLLWQMPLVGFGIALAGFLGGWFFRYGMRSGTPVRMATFHHVCTLCNYLFLPIIIVGNLWGEKYVTLLLLTNVGSVLGMWTLSIIAIQPGGFNRSTLKQVFGINFWALILAVAWVMLKIPVPPVIAKSVEMTANMNVPLLILLSG
ncbi:MAG: AEC family transporter, partial [Victivallales bacterium]|nr:AEC family transporter [Victivallales bacterium]